MKDGRRSVKAGAGAGAGTEPEPAPQNMPKEEMSAQDLQIVCA
jgi:hypothetical protein